MFSRGASYLWSNVKRIVAPTIVAAGRMVSTIGESLFILEKFIKYVTDKNNHPANFYASLGAISVNVIINISTRVPAIFHHFRSSSSSELPNQGEENQLTFVDDRNSVNEPDEETGLNCKGMSIYLTLKILNFASVPFALLGSYLNAITFIEFITKYGFNTDAHDETLESVSQAVALFLAGCNAATYVIYTLKKANQNAKWFAESIEKNDFSMDRCMVGTIALSTLGASTVPFLAFFSTSNAISKLPWVVVPTIFKNSAAGISSLTKTLSTLLTQTPALYSFMKSKKNELRYMSTLSWEEPIKGVVYFAGFGELIINTVANFTGTVNTSHEILNIDAKKIELILFASLTSLSSAALVFFFSVHQGLEQAIKQYRKNEPAYFALSQDEEPDKELNKELLEENELEENEYDNSEETIELKPYASFLLFKHDSSLAGNNDPLFTHQIPKVPIKLSANTLY